MTYRGYMGAEHELSYSFFSDMNKLLDENVLMSAIINDLEIENAMHKALFYGKHDLADRLCSAYDNNFNARVGEFNGFCYDSSRRGLKTKSIEKMYMNGEINREEYDFCKPMCEK